MSEKAPIRKRKLPLVPNIYPNKKPNHNNNNDNTKDNKDNKDNNDKTNITNNTINNNQTITNNTINNNTYNKNNNNNRYPENNNEKEDKKIENPVAIIFDEDDDFEEFEIDTWELKDAFKENNDLWKDDWNNNSIYQEFANQLRNDLQKKETENNADYDHEEELDID